MRPAGAAKTVLCGRSVKIRSLRRSRMPSIASPPRPAWIAPSHRNGHVMLPPRGGCQCLFARDCVLSYVEPGARRPSANASRSGEMESDRLSSPDTVCRLLQQRLTREHDLERPILARAGVRAFPPVPLRWPPLPARPLGRAACDSSPSSEGEQAASHAAPSMLVPASARLPGSGASKATALRERRVRGDVPSPPSVAPRTGEAVAVCVSWADSPGAKVPRPLSRTSREERREAPLLRSEASTLGRRSGVKTGRLEDLPHAAPS